MTPRFLLLALLALALLPLRALSAGAQPVEKSPEAPALQKQIEALLTAWVKQDFAGMEAVWSSRSTHWQPFRKNQERFYQDRHLVSLETLRFRGSVAEGKALLRVITRVTWESPLTLEKQTEPVVWNLYWEKEAGAWKILEFEDCSVTLWIAFNRAQTDEERAEVWRKDPEAANVWVVRQFGYAAEALAGQGEWEPAARASSLQREAARLLGDGRVIADSHASSGSIAFMKADYEAALRFWQDAETAFRAAGEPVGAARMQMNQGVALEGQGLYGRAMELTDQGFEALKRAGDPLPLATGYLNQGVLLFRLNRYGQALERLQKCVSLCQELKWEWGAAKALVTIAAIREMGGDYDAARQINEECLAVVRRFKQPREELATLNNLVIVYRDQGDHSRSARTGEEALKLARERHDAAMEATIATNLAGTYKELGRYGDAIRLLDAALAAFSRQGATPGTISTLTTLGVLYDLTEQTDAMLRSYQQALELSRKIGDHRAEASVQLGFANYHLLKGESRKANQALLAAVEAADAIQDLEAMLATRSAVAFLLNRAGNQELAIKTAEGVLQLARQARNRGRQAQALYIIGRAESALGKPDAALPHLQEAVTLAEGTGDRKQAMHARWHLGLVLDQLRRPKEALATYVKAAELLEAVRLDTQEQTLQGSFLAQWASYYHTLVGAYLKAGSPEQAFAAAERAKGRGLVDLLARGKVVIAGRLPAEERSAELKLQVQLTSYSTELERAQALTTDQRLALQEKLEKARADYEEFRRRLFLRHQELQVQRGEFTPATPAQVGQKLLARNPGACVLSYVSALDETLIFALTAGPRPGVPAQVTVFRVPVKLGELRDQAEQLRALCSQPGGAYQPAAKKLFSLLITPGAKLLAGKTHLVIVPDSALPPMPFQALLDGQGKHLAERFSVSYAPSVTALLAMGDLKERRTREKAAVPLLAVGRPQFTADADLPATETEVKRIGVLAGPRAKVVTGKDASEARVRAEIGSARFVHLATHGKLNEAAPMYSGLALTRGPEDDGLLEARELLDLDLKAEMVVLSACETALGKQVRGEGVLGLTWALFVAGAPTTVVTQWQVEDTSTGALMGSFYKALLQPARGTAAPTKAEALRRAQLALMRDGKHAHPYYWAPFVVAGDWR